MEASKMLEANVAALIQENGVLNYVLPKLASADIRYGLYAGAHVAVLTGNRAPKDVDLLVHDDDLEKLQTLFPFAKTSDLGSGVFLYIGEGDIVEFMGAADIVKDGQHYPFRLTDEAVEKTVTHTIDGLPIKLVDPVDSILLKSILQRGADQGKHDLEDIEAVLQNADIDTAYLSTRLAQANAIAIAKPLFDQFGIKLEI